MQIEYLFVLIAAFGSLVGTYTDLKWRMVPDWINFFMIFFGLGGHLLVSIIQNSIWPFLYSAIGSGVFFGIGLIMYYAGVWGGGDAKMLAGFGALLPLFAQQASAPWPFLATLWLNLLALGAAFGLLASAWLAIKHKEKFLAEFKILFQKQKILNVFYAGFFIFLLATSFRYGLFFYIALLVGLAWLAFPFLKAVENTCMYRKILPSRLTEGDWIAEEVKVGGFRYLPEREGISKENILKLIEFEKKGKLKEVLVKEGIPYVPAFLAGLLASIFYGDLLFSIIRFLII